MITKKTKMIMKRKKKEVYAFGQHICMSPHKARRVIDQIRGRSYEETMMILELMPYRACYPILKLVYSAASNASHNMGFNERDLVISKAEVNQGTTVKKLKPRAQGRSYPIKRPTCSITIVLKDTAVNENEKEFQRYQYTILILDLNKPGVLITKEKYTDMTCYDMYNNGGLWDKK
uniref:Large ribosomal subunit protein uL22c n=1 Tax=Cucumis melo subsp. melo TaxID=412675 RepID=A0A6B9M048_CUCME|nr:ribosomal protein L22 [Cucumis melo subsp. melo]